LCEALCGIEIAVRGDEVLSIRGDADDPFSRGHICPKAVALQDVHADPDRLRQPMRRTATGWEPLTWAAALDEAARRLAAVQRAHGRDAVALYYGNPTVHNLGAMLFSGVLARALATRHRYSASSVDQLPHHVVAAEMYGHPLLIPVPDLDRTDFLLILGANPVVSNGSLMAAPGVADRLRAVRNRGGRVVVVDPRRTETADLAREHLFIRPGADLLLMLGLLHAVFADRLANPGRLASHADGLDEVARVVAGFPPERVAEPTGIPADRIRTLARDFASARSAVCYGRLGVSTQEFGTLAQWLIQVLNFVTGNLDRPGGAMLTRPAIDIVGRPRRRRAGGYVGREHTRVRRLPKAGGEFPVAALSDEMLTAGPGQVRALLTLAGNPVLSTPNGRRLDRALAQLECMVSIDFYLNETTRHAHLILPPTSPLEHSHYDLALHVFGVRNTAKYSPPLFPRPSGALHDWEIMLELATRLAGGGPLAGTKSAIVASAARVLGPDGLVDIGLRRGPYGAGLRPWSRGLSLRRLKASPHGLDLGALEPSLPGRLHTPDRRIRIAPPAFLADVARAAGRALARPAGDRGSLLLIGRRDVRSNNSWMHNSARLTKGGERCAAQMHPDDAAARGIEGGTRVRVTSRTGSIALPVELTDRLMRGVVSVPHGWGHDRPGTGQRMAAEHAGASVNDLTDEQLVDGLSGNAALNGVPVVVEPLPPGASGR
jgi:anaerobic selenocysteine-containing dehydrogenase